MLYVLWLIKIQTESSENLIQLRQLDLYEFLIFIKFKEVYIHEHICL